MGGCLLVRLFSFSLSLLAGEGSRLLRRLARRFKAFDFVTFVDESIVDGNDMRCLLLALLVELRLLASGIVHRFESFLFVAVVFVFAPRRFCFVALLLMSALPDFRVDDRLNFINKRSSFHNCLSFSSLSSRTPT